MRQFGATMQIKKLKEGQVPKQEYSLHGIKTLFWWCVFTLLWCLYTNKYLIYWIQNLLKDVKQGKTNAVASFL